GAGLALLALLEVGTGEGGDSERDGDSCRRQNVGQLVCPKLGLFGRQETRRGEARAIVLQWPTAFLRCYALQNVETGHGWSTRLAKGALEQSFTRCQERLLVCPGWAHATDLSLSVVRRTSKTYSSTSVLEAAAARLGR